MANYYDDSWLKNNNWGKWGPDDEVGMLNEMTPEMVVNAVKYVKTGKVYDLDTLRFKGMPVWPGHCGYDLVTYSSASGRRNMACDSTIPPDFNWTLPGAMLGRANNQVNLGLNTEMVVAPLHLGTHIDALCHWSVGEDDHWYNGFKAADHCTTFGVNKCDESKIPPMVMRGVLLDIAGYKGLDHVAPHYAITAEDCEGCAKWEGVELRKGDAVMMRTGFKWPDGECPGAGVGLSAARYLIEGCGAFILGDDMADIDAFDENGISSVDYCPEPTHQYLLIQSGVHILEFLQLDELAADKKYEFCFVCTPTKFFGATGMPVRPIAIV
ncbi:MAG: cyclase family protein [Oscillospiraceae bacterium]